MKLVVVKFYDTTTFDHWATLDDMEKSKCKVCLACGFLMEEDEKVTKVALLMSEDKKATSTWAVIPTPAIITCDVIKEIDWKVSDA